jgi:hypothetical protein
MGELENKVQRLSDEDVWLSAYLAVLSRRSGYIAVAKLAADLCLEDFKERFDVKKAEG